MGSTKLARTISLPTRYQLVWSSKRVRNLLMLQGSKQKSILRLGEHRGKATYTLQTGRFCIHLTSLNEAHPKYGEYLREVHGKVFEKFNQFPVIELDFVADLPEGLPEVPVYSYIELETF